MVTSVGMTGFNNMFNGFNTNSASQYMDSSIFGTGMYPMGYCGFGFGLGNDQMYNYMEHGLDNQTSLTFAQQGNMYTLGSYQEVMQKELPAMANAIRNGDFGKATQIYKEIYNTISMKNGEELTEQGQRVAYERAIKATITNLYQQINGTRLADDIEAAGEGYFSNGFMQGLTLNDHHKNSAEETISYMTGESIEGYSGKKLVKNIGKVAGAAVSTGGAAGLGALVGYFMGGPVIGAVIGGGLALAKLLFSNNTPSQVTEG